MFRPPTKYSEYLQDVRKSIDYILKRVNATTVTQIVAGTNVTISPASGTGVVTINASGGGATPTLAQVTTAGNTTTNAITVGGFTSNASSTIVGAAAGTIGTRVLTVEGSLPEIWFKDTFSAADSFVLSKYGSLFYFARTSSTGVFINYAGAINPSGASWSFGHGGNPTATVHIKGADVLSSTKALLVQNSSPTDLLTIWNDGAVGINTSTNAGYKLDVNGTARVSGTIRVGSTFNGTLATLADFRGASDANFVQIARETDTNRGVKIYASGMIIASSIETSGAAYSFLNNVSGSASSGNRLFFNISGGWAPTSGTASWDQVRLNPTINTTGTYAGIVRGIYYNPTLTSLTGTTHRAIETTSGDVLLGTTSGNVGIGTTTPTAKLHIKGTGDSSVWVTTDDFNSGTNTGTVIRIGTRSSTGNTQGWIDALNSGVSSYGNLIIAGFGGNVLIGTTTDAGYKLDVNGTARVSGIVYADSTINQPTSFGNKLLFMNSGNYSKIALADGTNWSLDYHSGITVADVGYHRFYTGSTSGWVERLRIENNGNVGIGTTTPTDKLHIVDNTNGNKFGRISAGGTDASAAWVVQNDQVDNVVYRVFGSAVSGTQMGISLARSASLLATLGGSGKFFVGTYSSTDFVMGTGNQERMRLVDSTGNFLVGTTTDLGNKLEVSGTVNATAYKINNVIGYTGILNIPTNPPGQQNVDIQSGIVVNIF